MAPLGRPGKSSKMMTNPNTTWQTFTATLDPVSTQFCRPSFFFCVKQLIHHIRRTWEEVFRVCDFSLLHRQVATSTPLSQDLSSRTMNRSKCAIFATLPPLALSARWKCPSCAWRTRALMSWWDLGIHGIRISLETLSHSLHVAACGWAIPRAWNGEPRGPFEALCFFVFRGQSRDSHGCFVPSLRLKTWALSMLFFLILCCTNASHYDIWFNCGTWRDSPGIARTSWQRRCFDIYPSARGLIGSRCCESLWMILLPPGFGLGNLNSSLFAVIKPLNMNIDKRWQKTKDFGFAAPGGKLLDGERLLRDEAVPIAAGGWGSCKFPPKTGRCW